MVNTEIRFIIFFVAKYIEALYSHQKQDWDWLWLRSWAPYCKIKAEIENSEENHHSI